MAYVKKSEKREGRFGLLDGGVDFCYDYKGRGDFAMAIADPYGCPVFYQMKHVRGDWWDVVYIDERDPKDEAMQEAGRKFAIHFRRMQGSPTENETLNDVMGCFIYFIETGKNVSEIRGQMKCESAPIVREGPQRRERKGSRSAFSGIGINYEI